MSDAPVGVEQAYRRLGRALIGARRLQRLDPHTLGTAAATSALTETVGRLRALGVFTAALEEGQELEAALVAAVRALLDVGRPNRATALAVRVGSMSDGAAASRLGLGLVIRAAGFRSAAWGHFAEVPAEVLATHVPVEAVECAFVAGSLQSRSRALELVDHTAVMEFGDLVEVAGMYYAAGARAEAARVLGVAEARLTPEVPPEQRAALAQLQRWVQFDPDAGIATAPITVGVLGPHRPDPQQGSGSLGPYLHALAVLGNLARFTQVRWTGDPGLSSYLQELKQRIPTDTVEPSEAVASPVAVVPVSRDFSVGEPIAPGTWVIAAGRHVDQVSSVRYAFPFHPHVRPIFVSFHLAVHDVLDPETIDYLQRHGPVGCRDWTTVGMLLSVGVDAFFTGCIDSTLGQVVTPATPRSSASRRSAGALYVDVDPPSPGQGTVLSHEQPQRRTMALVDGVREAEEMLRRYRDQGESMVTSRLSAYLSAVAVGVPVDFRPSVPGDIRYDGLLGLTPGDDRMTQMSERIQTLIAQVFDEILRGRSEDEVYARWRDLTSDLVHSARTRWQEPVTLTEGDRPICAALSEAVRTVAGRSEVFGPSVVSVDRISDIALSVDANLKDILPTTLESLVSNASGPIRLWITTRDVSAHYRSWVAAAFPEVPITFLDFTGIEYGKVSRLFRHITVTTMDRLILPEVLRDVDQLTYVDIDTVTEGDICELATIDLGDHPVAGKNPDGRVGFYVWRDAGNLLDPERASQLRRWMSARQTVMFPTLNAGVMVLNLALMRSERFVSEFLPLAFRYGLNDQDIINAYAGPRRLELDARWNAIPRQEVIEAPGIVHYAGGSKPWGKELVPYGDQWKRWHQQLVRRVGTSPV